MLRDLIVPKNIKTNLQSQTLPYQIGWIHCYRGCPIETIDSNIDVKDEYKKGYNDCINYQHRCA